MRYPLKLDVRPAKGAIASVLALHMLAGLALFHLSLPLPWVFAGATTVICASACYGLWQEAGKSHQVLLEHDGGVSIRLGGREFAVRVSAGGAVDFGWAVWLSLHPAGGGDLPWRLRRLMLLPANLPAGHWRLFRIWLRHRATKAPAA